MSEQIFVSYATKYDLYEGEVDVGDLPPELQDEFIRQTLSVDGDGRALVMRHNIRKRQAEGLWSLVVLLGTALENKRTIKDFDNRSDADVQLIIEQLAEFALWQRLEEAYPPFDFLEEKSKYDWSELETIAGPFFESHSGNSLYELQVALFSVLTARDFDETYDTRISYDCCVGWLNEKKILIHQDRMLAPLAGVSGKVKSNSPYLVFGGIAFLIATPIVWYQMSVLVALMPLASAFVAFKLSRSTLRNAVFRAALSSKETYRWLMSRKILWVTYKE